MSNPFEQADREYYVLRNAEEQYSLWPAAIPVPAGWEIAFGPAVKASCQLYIEETWVDMRPKSLRSLLG
ncbi:MbtH family protein [Solibacillus sp. FSL W8-0474]|uniref:MbtH family protein n=1 Tax=Solibacillus sp. FSL W8-0474 TaxID=2975336 RepID=UPI0030F5A902